jgi:hypothetical protein
MGICVSYDDRNFGENFAAGSTNLGHQTALSSGREQKIPLLGSEPARRTHEAIRKNCRIFSIQPFSASLTQFVRHFSGSADARVVALREPTYS